MRATRLGISPAAVSQAVGKLEHRLGLPLFQRTTCLLRLPSEFLDFSDASRNAGANAPFGWPFEGRRPLQL